MDSCFARQTTIGESIRTGSTWPHFSARHRVQMLWWRFCLHYALPYVLLWIPCRIIGLPVWWGLALAIEIAFYAWIAMVHVPRACAKPLVVEPPRRSMHEVLESLLQGVEEAASVENGYPAERWLAGWFLDADASQICCENLAELFAFMFFMKDLTEFDATMREGLDGMVARACARLRFNLQPGYNPAVRCMRFGRDPVLVVHRSLLIYLIAGEMPRILAGVVFRFVCGLQRVRCQSTGLYYWWRPARGFPADGAGERDLLFFHGLGGYPGYVYMLAMLLRKSMRGAVLVEDENVMICCRTSIARPSRALVVETVRIALQRLQQGRPGLSPGCVAVGQSLGTCSVNWVLEDLPTVCGAVAFVDPIVVLLELPNTTYSFLYRAPRGVFAWFCFLWCSTEPSVALFFRRRFYWYNCRLMDASVANIPVLFCISELDELIATGVVHQYVRRNIPHADLRWWKNIVHSGFMMTLKRPCEVVKWVREQDPGYVHLMAARQ